MWPEGSVAIFFVYVLLCRLTLTLARGNVGPRVEISPRYQSVATGDVAFFFCTAVGYPNPKFEWKKNSRSFFPARYTKIYIPNGSVLRIESVRQGRDQAVFKCIAENGFDEPVTTTAALNVLPDYPRGFPQFVPQSSIKVGNIDGSVSLPCQVNATPSPTVTWLKYMVPLDMTISRYSIVNGSLNITDLDGDDEASYECVAENYIGVAVQSPINLYVKDYRRPAKFTAVPDRKYVLKAGTNLSLPCSAVGDPMPTVEWYVGCVDITPIGHKPIGENLLLLENFTLPANYTCVAASEKGRIRRHTSILVPENHVVNRKGQPKIVFLLDCECERRNLKIPEDKNCRPVYQAGCACPDYYTCPDKDSTFEGVVTTPENDYPLKCSPVICGLTCREIVGKFGCPTCDCNPCPPLNCSSGCEPQSATLPWQCPVCVCE